jgi:hypothetical protein
VRILTNVVLVLIATKLSERIRQKPCVYGAPEAFECSSVANSDVELQIKMDLTLLISNIKAVLAIVAESVCHTGGNRSIIKV